MQIYDNLIEELLGKPCYVIDFLPEQVASEGLFFWKPDR